MRSQRPPRVFTTQRYVALAHYRLSWVLPPADAAHQLNAAIAVQQRLVAAAPTLKAWANELAEFQRATTAR